MASELSIYVNQRFDAELSSASSMEIHERMGEPTRFALRFPLVETHGDLPLASDPRLAPGTPLSIRYQDPDGPKVLVEGPITGQTLRIEHGGGDSWIEVSGADVSVVMDREVKSAVWDGSDADAVRSILQQNSIDATDVSSTDSRHTEDKHVLVQRDSDLRFVQRLARRNGFLFWVTQELGRTVGHFKLPPVDTVSPGQIRLNQEPPTALAFEIRVDVERPTGVEGLQVDLSTKENLDLSSATSPLTLLGDTDLKTLTADARTVVVTAPVDDAGDLDARGQATLIEAGWFVSATCTTTRPAFGSVLRAHTAVEVSGIGRRHSGRYFVAGVRHLVDSSAHRMVVDLLRNAWGR